MKVAIVCREVYVGRRLAAALETLRCPYSVLMPSGTELSTGATGTVYCVDSRLAAELSRLPDPTVITLSGALVSDEVMEMLRLRRVSTLRIADITPASLLSALLSATTGRDPDDMVERLRQLELLRRVDRAVIAAFLTDPSRMLRLEDLRRALAPLSREAAQALTRSCGFQRAEHLFTALRIASWVLLVEAGLSTHEVEQYLGICDRGSFRRACRRAGVPTLRRGLRPDALAPAAVSPAGI